MNLLLMAKAKRRGASAPTSFNDKFDRADGALGNGWLCTGTAAISEQVILLNPALSAELNVTANAASDPNGNEANGTGGTAAATSTWSSDGTVKKAGSYSLKLTVTGANGNGYISMPHTLNAWYRITCEALSGAPTDPSYPLQLKSWSNLIPTQHYWNINQYSWEPHVVTGRCLSNTFMRLYAYLGNTNDVGWVDNVSCKRVTFADMHAAKQWTNTGTYNAFGRINLPPNVTGGIFVEVDDYTNPQNGIYFVINGSNKVTGYANVWTLTGGTWAVLINDTLYNHLYGKKLEVRKRDATTYGFYYDGVQIGTDKTISNANLGKYFGPILTGPETTCKEFEIGPYNATPAADVGINAATYLTIPTYDGSDQPEHPSVLYFAGGWGWSGRKYWMAMTPYPNRDSTKENPSIVCSTDGTTWAVPTGLTNPISGLPDAGNYYSDPHLFMSADGVTMYCVYRHTETASATGILYLQSSTDGVTWSDKVSIWTGSSKVIVSHSINWDAANSCWNMWSVNSGVYPYTIELRTSADLTTWSDVVTTCDMGITAERTGKFHWHPFVMWNATNARWEMLDCMCYPSTSLLDEVFFAYSADGITWTMDPNVAISVGPAGAWDYSYIYRSTMVYLGKVGGKDAYDVFYAARHELPTNYEKVGRTTYLR